MALQTRERGWESMNTDGYVRLSGGCSLWARAEDARAAALIASEPFAAAALAAGALAATAVPEPGRVGELQGRVR